MKTYTFYGMYILCIALCIAFVMTNSISKGFGYSLYGFKERLIKY